MSDEPSTNVAATLEMPFVEVTVADVQSTSMEISALESAAVNDSWVAEDSDGVAPDGIGDGSGLGVAVDVCAAAAAGAAARISDSTRRMARRAADVEEEWRIQLAPGWPRRARVLEPRGGLATCSPRGPSVSSGAQATVFASRISTSR